MTLKLLIGKQMTEIFRSYFYDPKRNRARSRGATVVLFALYALLMVGVLGGMFGAFAYLLCGAFVAAGFGWLYFTLFAIVAVALGTFGSVFNTYSGLYLAKDNDLLLSMPISVRDIMISRLTGVYLVGLMYSATVMLPAVLVYWFTAVLTVKALLGTLLLILLVSVIVLFLSCLLGWVVAKVSRRLKHKSVTVVLLSLVLIGLYYFAYYQAQDVITGMLADLSGWGTRLQNGAYPLYLLGRVGEGSPIAMAIVTAVVALLFGLLWWLMSRSFLQIATAGSAGSRAVYRERTDKRQSAERALLRRELARFTGSPAYMLNCGLGLLLLVVVAVVLFVKGGALGELLEGLTGGQQGALLPFLCTALGMMIATVDITAPSISLEGKSLWLAQSLPVTAWQILRAKLWLQLLLVVPLACICAVAGAVALRIGALGAVAAVLFGVVFSAFSAVFGLVLGLCHPSLNWTSEIYPIKQSLCVFLALFGGWLVAILPSGISLLLRAWICAEGCLIGYTVLLLALTVLLLVWLKRSGVRRFQNL